MGAHGHCGNLPQRHRGGNMRIGRGLGVVLEMRGICYWSFLGQSYVIKENTRTISGDRVGLKMTFLEACAALLGISSMAKLLVNKPIVIYCDTIGTVFGFAKGYSRCLYAHTALRCFLACYPSSSSTAQAPTGTDRLAHAQISQISRKLHYLLIQVT